MAITRHETQVTWSAANAGTCGVNSELTSDAISVDATCFQAQVHMKALNTTTAATDDQILMWLRQSGGDPDGAGTAEYDSSKGGLRLAVLDTFVQTPFLRTAELPVPQSEFTLHADGTEYGTTNAIVVSATITEHRSS